MQCKYPVFLQSQNLEVPCGKCVSCRMARTREWATRILHELSYHDCSQFVTLTYSDDHLPDPPSISKVALQKFVKRLRRRLDGRKIKYYACGEYGDKSARPHYHLIMFGISHSDIDDLKDCWPFGFVYRGTVTYDSAAYVAGYVQKKYSGALAESVYTNNGLEVPFQLVSQGFGKQYCQDNRDQLTRKLGCTVHGAEVGLPRYYRKVLEIPTEVLAVKAIAAQDKIRRVKKFIYLDQSDYLSAVVKSRAFADKTLVAKLGLKPKKL
nr:MAG: replication initiator protein [Microviridae sp.]